MELSSWRSCLCLSASCSLASFAERRALDEADGLPDGLGGGLRGPLCGLVNLSGCDVDEDDNVDGFDGNVDLTNEEDDDDDEDEGLGVVADDEVGGDNGMLVAEMSPPGLLLPDP